MTEKIKFEDMAYKNRREILRYDYMHTAAHHKAADDIKFIKEHANDVVRKLSTI